MTGVAGCRERVHYTRGSNRSHLGFLPMRKAVKKERALWLRTGNSRQPDVDMESIMEKERRIYIVYVKKENEEGMF